MVEDEVEICVTDALTGFKWIEPLTLRADCCALFRLDASTKYTAEFESLLALAIALGSWDVGLVAAERTQAVATVYEIVLSFRYALARLKGVVPSLWATYEALGAALTSA